ncbi:MAG TPA: glycosyltransferase family 2 protein [Bryobacteraceae bacterium]|nr:glycosyltransferase family 2 protein [Bryobacteraceae bacterium]
MLFSVVIPVFNEEDAIGFLLKALRDILARIACDWEVIFVNDGSYDRTAELVEREARNDSRIRLLSFGRNFGHQAAITAGLDFASGDAIVVMDADLQDPPEILIDMLDKYYAGYDVVSAQRVSRASDSFFKRTTAAAFYWVMRRMVDERLMPEVGDFRLFSRPALQAIRRFREQHRFMRGLVAWLGLREAVVPFERKPRVAGQTKYPFWKMLRFAWTAISSFSALPLRLTVGLGACLFFVGLGYLGWAFVVILSGQATLIRGWVSVIALQSLFFGATFLAIGVMGDYVGRIYEEIKCRPLYVVTSTVNLVPPSDGVPRSVVLANTERSRGLVREDITADHVLPRH